MIRLTTMLYVLTYITEIKLFAYRGLTSNLPFFHRNSYEMYISNKKLRSSKLFVKSKEKKSFPFHSDDEFELIIEDMTNLGIGIGRKTLNDGSRWVVMVPLVLPGEEVRVKIVSNTASYSTATLLKVLVPSNDRIQPKCEYFSTCGGCQYQHMNISSQHKWKKLQVENSLLRIGKINEFTVNEVIGTNDTYEYRSKITPHLELTSYGKFLKMGFQKRGTNEIIDVKQCIISSKLINEEYLKTRLQMSESNKYLTSNKHISNSKSTILFRESDNGYIEKDSKKYVTQTVNNIKFVFQAGDFFQNNPYVLPLMQKYVQNEAVGDNCINLIDVYCGSGFFGLSLAKYFTSVYGIEINSESVKAANQNALINHITNTMFINGSSENIFGHVQQLAKDKTVVILDPPRNGCDLVFLQQLFEFYPCKIIYISCDPATQARDAKIILEAGYRITKITPFDMFPQTRHIENIITFLSTKQQSYNLK